MDVSISRILFATDLSDNSTYAFHHTVSLAKMTGAKIHVLHVSEQMSEDAVVTLQMFVQDETTRQKMLKDRVSHVKKTLEERQAKFWANISDDKQKVQDQIETMEVIEGHPAEAILRRSEQLNCDLIVLGAHDHGFSHTFLGTVAKRVLRRSRIPTLVVPFKEG